MDAVPQGYVLLPISLKHFVGLKVEVHPTFDTAFYKIVNAIGDIREDV